MWTGENDSNTLRVDAIFFKNGEKNLRSQKYPYTCGQGHTCKVRIHALPERKRKFERPTFETSNFPLSFQVMREPIPFAHHCTECTIPTLATLVIDTYCRLAAIAESMDTLQPVTYLYSFVTAFEI